MDRSAVAYLIAETFQKDAYGVLQPTTTRKKIYCDVSSVSMSEWFEGGRNGLNPELRLTMFSGDYNGEKLIEYNGTEYSIYRTYLARNNSIELYVERRGGNG